MGHPAKSKPGQAGRQQGFSLLEAIMVVVVTLVLVALTAKSMLSARDNYNLSSAARQVASLAQLARTKAMARFTRFQVKVSTTGTTANTYRMEVCTSPNATTNACDAWDLDPLSADTPLPSGVTFSTSQITGKGAAGETPAAQATEMTFNSRGLLWDSPNKTPADVRCFYLQSRTLRRPMAVCSTMVGQTTVYRLYGTNWEKQ